MKSIFVRSLALAAAPDAACVTNASRTPADGTFAVASRTEGVIQIYAASCAALLHEFATIHPRVHALHYTSFSDSLVTLESDKPTALHLDDVLMDGDEETFLCVYHDWRERNMVRGYTLPLGVLDTPSTRRKADCVAVCSYTGRVVVAMGSVLNLWQCSQGFFEHVMELQVDMTQVDAYHVVEYVAIHGVYVAFGSSTEVRVMEVHVRNSKEEGERTDTTPQVQVGLDVAAHRHESAGYSSTALPEDDPSCVHFDVHGDMSAFESIPIPLASYGDVIDESDHLHLHEKSTYSEYDEVPVVLDRDEAQQEELNLAGLIKHQDVRVNQAMNYYIAENDVRIILRRYLPPNQRIQTLKFLPETIDNHVSLEARSYTRLLVGTVDHAFLYYFLSSEVDVTRKKMAKKVLGKGDFRRQTSTAARSSPTSADYEENSEAFDASSESGRVVMHYAFSSPVTSITANSSFLFVTSSSSLQVWSIWSPCHHLAATRTLNSAIQHEPTHPQLISVQPLPFPAREVAALDSYVVVLPRKAGETAFPPRDFLRIASLAATQLLPRSEFEMRGSGVQITPPVEHAPNMQIFQQSPPSGIFSLVRSAQDMRPQTRVDLLLSLYSLYRYRADVGANVLAEATPPLHAKTLLEPRETMALQLETGLYDRLACECAAELATMFLTVGMRDWTRASLFFVESKAPPGHVLRKLQQLADVDHDCREEVVQATHRYLQARVFQPATLRGRPQQESKVLGAGIKPDQTFTQSVVRHYMEHAPEQLTRLIIDSSLSWTLRDLHFGYESLETGNLRDGTLTKIARLVLTLRAQSVTPDGWTACSREEPLVYDAMQKVCSSEAFAASVASVVQDDRKSLLRLCVAHPDLLVQSDKSTQGRQSSELAQSLLAHSPLAFAQILEAVFDSAISRRESVFGSVLLCLSAIGSAVQSSFNRISHRDPTLVASDAHTDMRSSHAVLLRFLCFVLDAFPRLHALAEKDDISEDDEELLNTHRLLATELVHLCVRVAAAIRDEAGSQGFYQQLTVMFSPSKIADFEIDGIPEWELAFLASRCALTHIRPDVLVVVQHLFQRALLLLHEGKLVSARDILASYEATRGSNDFGFLLVLLALPRARRTVDGLRMLAEREAFVDLFLPYGKSYCATLEEWKLLIETLSSLGESNTPAASVRARACDELGVLESVLNHVCSTLGPEDLLQVLPDEGDLALFMGTIEASVRMADERAVVQ